MTSALRIETPRLRLFPADLAIARVMSTNDHALLASAVGARVAPDWPEPLLGEHLTAIPKWYEAMSDLGPWGMWMVLLKDASAKGATLVGTAGFKGKPTPRGECEVGYGVVQSVQRRGLATEATRGLIEWAFTHPEVAIVIAHTLPGHESSLGVMRKCAMTSMGEGPIEDGLETVRWGVTREEFAIASRAWRA